MVPCAGGLFGLRAPDITVQLQKEIAEVTLFRCYFMEIAYLSAMCEHPSAM